MCKVLVMGRNMVHWRNRSIESERRKVGDESRAGRALFKILGVMRSHGRQSGDTIQYTPPVIATPGLLSLIQCG